VSREGTETPGDDGSLRKEKREEREEGQRTLCAQAWRRITEPLGAA